MMPLRVRTDTGERTLPKKALVDTEATTPEPHQPGEAETMPWVQLGTGADTLTLANGTKQISLKLKTVGNRTITATDVANATINGTSPAIAVN